MEFEQIPKIDINDEDNTPQKKELSDFDYFKGRKPTRTYVSKRLYNRIADGTKRSLRIVSKVIDSKEGLKLAKLNGEIVLRITPSGRQQIIAKVFEDNRNNFRLVIQRFTTRFGTPHETYFSFDAVEVKILLDFIKSIPYLDFSDDGKSRVEDDEIRKIKEFLAKNPDTDLLIEFAQNRITKADIVALGYRKKQLEIFEKLLDDTNYFQAAKSKLRKTRDEDVWQWFFEKNTWIFGYGLSYVFNSPLEGKKLEQVVGGNDFNSSGKRADGLMKTRSLVNSLCLAEIKTPKVPLLKQNANPYRSDCWQVSDELNGGVAQSQKTAQKTIENIGTKIEIKKKDGDPTGEIIYSFKPKSYLIVGNLAEFKTEAGVNEEKFSSFELFRKNMINPEIITFDELYERAKFIVHNDEERTAIKQ